jgi:hypothetical protein
MFERIKKWYKQGLWSADMVQKAVEKDILTEDQAKEILSQEVAV